MWSAVCWHKSMFQRVPVTSVLDDSFGPNNNNNGVLFLFRSVFFAEDFLGVAVLFFSNSNSNSKRCGSLSLGTFFFIIKDIVVSNRNDLLADLERQQEQPQKEKHWTNTQPHLRNSCSSVARRRSIAPTLGTRRSLRKQALIKRGTRVDSHLRATDIPPKTKKKTGDYPPPPSLQEKRERERPEKGRPWKSVRRRRWRRIGSWFVCRRRLRLVTSFFRQFTQKRRRLGGGGGPSAVERYLKDTRAKILVNVVVLSPSPPFFLTQIWM